jgi:hypothetical protein
MTSSFACDATTMTDSSSAKPRGRNTLRRERILIHNFSGGLDTWQGALQGKRSGVGAQCERAIV